MELDQQKSLLLHILPLALPAKVNFTPRSIHSKTCIFFPFSLFKIKHCILQLSGIVDLLKSETVE